MIQKISFTGGPNKTLASQYLARKAAQVEADLAESIRYAGRVIINKNKEAARKGMYIPEDAYFGPVPLQERRIGQKASMDSITITKTNVAGPDEAPKTDKIIPENSINFFG